MGKKKKKHSSFGKPNNSIYVLGMLGEVRGATDESEKVEDLRTVEDLVGHIKKHDFVLWEITEDKHLKDNSNNLYSAYYPPGTKHITYINSWFPQFLSQCHRWENWGTDISFVLDKLILRHLLRC